MCIIAGLLIPQRPLLFLAVVAPTAMDTLDYTLWCVLLTKHFMTSS